MSQYAELLEEERARLELLRSEFNLCLKRIEALEFLANTVGDDGRFVAPPAIPGGVVSPSASVSAQPVVSQEPKGQVIRIRKGSVAVHILPFIGTQTKGLDEIIGFLQKKVGKEFNRGSVRTILMNLRVKNQLLENPEHGRYRLSQTGLKWLSEFQSATASGQLSADDEL